MISAADLFCGAGGTSTGLARACQRLDLGQPKLVAVNHWQRAVDAHEANHPWADHYCARADQLDPRAAVPSGRLDLLVAGVECTHHSHARGGRPMSDQSRASAWHVLHWCEHLRVRDILIENVPEFLSWGPLNDEGRPDKARKGETFKAFVQALDSLGYRVEWRILNCANYGDPTTRRRLFLRARRGGPIEWPEQSHAEEPEGDLAPWRTAREVIDWSELGGSIFTRKRPLADRTMERIAEGIRRYCSPEHVEPFLVLLYGTSSVRSIDQPIPTVTASGGNLALAQPFLLPHDQFKARNGLSLVDSVDRPMRTIGAKNGSCNYLVTPFLVPHYGERPGQKPRTHSLDKPLPTVPSSKPPVSLCTPFLVTYYGTKKGGAPRTNKLDAPLPTVTTENRFGLCAPSLMPMDIFFRMLQPRELAAAQGFPDGYQFVGTKSDRVRQIGNAVPVNTAEALCAAALREVA